MKLRSKNYVVFGLILSLFIALVPQKSVTGTEFSGVSGAALMPLGGSGSIMGQSEDERYGLAGLSKLPAVLTLAMAFDDGILKEDSEMRCSDKAAAATGPTAFLEKGESISAGQLIKAAVMISAGDAILTLAENGFGSEAVFVENMAVVLGELGLTVLPEDALGTGLKLSCSELLILAQAAAESECFTHYSGLYMDELMHSDGRRTELVNANRMIRSYAGCYGLMTGSSRDDGYCGVFVAVQREMAYVCAVVGASNSETRFEAATELFNRAFANYEQLKLSVAGGVVKKDAPVRGGEVDSVDVIALESMTLLVQKGGEKGELVTELPEALTAPLYADTPVGRVNYYAPDGSLMATVQLYPAKDVEAYGVKELLFKVIRDFVS